MELIDAKNIRWVVCKKCSLAYSTPRANKKKAQEIYCKENYRDLDQTNQKSFTQEYLEWASQTNSERANWILQNISLRENNDENRMLDIGCAAGHLMQAFKKRGWLTLGIEPNELSAKYGQDRFSLEIIIAFYEELELSYKHEHFELITLSHILEHIYDPVGFLLSIKPLLKENGYIFIEVPNIIKPEGHLFKLFHSTHLYSFSPLTLDMLLKKTGLSITVMDDSRYCSTMHVIRTIARKGPQIRVYFFKKDEYKKIVWIVRRCRIKYFLTIRWKTLLYGLIKNLLIKIFGCSQGTKSLDSILGLKR